MYPVSRKLQRYLFMLLLWSGCITVSFYVQWQRETDHMLESSSRAALATINKDISFRRWATDHGGVYVRPTERTPSNPYLIHPYRDVLTTDGQALTLMNPAYMLREMQTRYADEYGTQTHLVSLKPLNPNNAPDAWQTQALQRFETGESVVLEVSELDGKPHMRVMHPFKVESACLQCHAHQGYQLGEIRGGISASIPLGSYVQEMREQQRFIALAHASIWLIGLTGLRIGYRRERHLDQLRQRADDELRENEALYRSVTNNGQALIWLADINKSCFFFNQPWLEFTGRTVEEEYGDGWLEGVHPEDRASCLNTFIQAFDRRDKFSMVYRLRRHDGEYRWILDEGAPRHDSQHNFVGYIGHCFDITERKLMEEELRISARVFEGQEGVFITDAQGVILRVNRAFEEITGWPSEEAIGQTPRLLKSGQQDASFYVEMWASLLKQQRWSGEIINRRRNGECYPQWLSITAVADEDGTVRHYVATLTDITARKQAEQAIEQLAFYDPLTGVPNRRLLLDRLQQQLLNHRRSGVQGALLMIDLDNFKQLNDTLGHQQGDLLLTQVARRLEASVRKGDTVARLGGDEFIVLLQNLGHSTGEAAAHADRAAHKLLQTLALPYTLDNQTYPISGSIGVTLFQPDAEADALITQADIAMYQAKADGRNTLRFFDRQMQDTIAERAKLEQALRLALTDDQLLLYYQPQVDPKGELIGAEALLRWQHPERGLMSPLEFIPLAEETGLIIPLGHWVLTQACRTLAYWRSQPERRQLNLSVNVSARQFMQPNFTELLQEILEKTGADPQQLKLELTESVLLENIDQVATRMQTLRDLGIGFSIDDFGTGYSSLSYLKRLPLNQLKIDQSFVNDILVNPNDAAITRTIIALAHSLELDVIAEGVETEHHLRALHPLGCDAYQGYHFGHPMPLTLFERWWQEASSRNAAPDVQSPDEHA